MELLPLQMFYVTCTSHCTRLYLRTTKGKAFLFLLCFVDLYFSPNIFSSDKFEKNEMGGVCSAYVGVEKRIQSFGGET